MTVEQALERLSKAIGDDEFYHSLFDDILEEKLAEYDPKFMEALQEAYENSGMARWCA